MDYQIIGFFIYQHWNYVIVQLMKGYTTKTFNMNTSVWYTLLKFTFAYSVQIAVTYNIRLFLFIGSNNSNLGFHSSWKFWWIEYILIFWVFIGNVEKGTLRMFLQILWISFSRRSHIFYKNNSILEFHTI